MKALTILTSIFFLFISACKEEPITDQNEYSQSLSEKHQEFYSNGKVKIKGDLVKGLKQGKWESFYENGTKWSESNYLFGKRNGTYKIFYLNGRIKIHGGYENDQKSGIWFFYTEDGKFEKEIDFNTINSDENDSI